MPACVRSASSRPGRRSSICSSVTRPGSRGNEISPRLPEAITAISGSGGSPAQGVAGPGSGRRRARRTAPSPCGPVIVGRLASSARPASSGAGAPPRRRRPRRARAASPACALYELLQRLAVALQERRTLRLAVIGQHDEPVGARRVLDGVGRSAAIARSTRPQHRERVGALDARVVRDLVVGEERRVDDRPAGEHVGGDGGDLQVELERRSRMRARTRRRLPRLMRGCTSRRRPGPRGATSGRSAGKKRTFSSNRSKIDVIQRSPNQTRGRTPCAFSSSGTRVGGLLEQRDARLAPPRGAPEERRVRAPRPPVPRRSSGRHSSG